MLTLALLFLGTLPQCTLPRLLPQSTLPKPPAKATGFTPGSGSKMPVPWETPQATKPPTAAPPGDGWQWDAERRVWWRYAQPQSYQTPRYTMRSGSC